MRLILDRIVSNELGKKIAVFENDDSFINVSEEQMPNGLIDKLYSGVIIEADYSNGAISNVRLLTDETENKRAEMKSRLSRFSRKK